MRAVGGAGSGRRPVARVRWVLAYWRAPSRGSKMASYSSEAEAAEEGKRLLRAGLAHRYTIDRLERIADCRRR